MKKKHEKQRRERIIRNKDIEALGLDSAKMQVNMCKDKPDKRMYDWAKERREYGFDSRETWNFNQTLFEFLYTRLKMYDRVNNVDTQVDTVTCTVYGEEKDKYRIPMQKFLDCVLKDLETILVNSEEYYFDNDAETACMDAGKRVLAGLSECIFAIWW